MENYRVEFRFHSALVAKWGDKRTKTESVREQREKEQNQMINFVVGVNRERAESSCYENSCQNVFRYMFTVSLWQGESFQLGPKSVIYNLLFKERMLVPVLY